MEFQTAKEDGYLPGLACLDTARCINRIVEILPHYLQERWISCGMKYKEENNATFPPFWYFTNFICYEVKARNDPSFAIPSNSYSKGEKPISVHKIEHPRSPLAQTQLLMRMILVETVQFTVNLIHSMKTLEERKTYLKNHSICFQCCASSSDLADNCKVPVKCTECDNKDHVTAPYPGLPLWVAKAPSPSSEHGGEGDPTALAPSVNSACTKVCGEGLPHRSCSKICLVQVYPKDKPQAAKEFFEHFNIHSTKI